MQRQFSFSCSIRTAAVMSMRSFPRFEVFYVSALVDKEKIFDWLAHVVPLL